MVTKGIFQETFSKVILVLAGFVLNVVLARELGPADYGIVGIILSIMFVFELFLTNGLRQSVSKIISSQQVNTRSLYRQSFLIQMAFSLVLVVGGLLILGKVAEWLNIEEYKNLLYLILVIIPVKGVFFLNLGFLNGQFKYKQHALANSVYSVFRLVIALILLYITHNGVLAVLLGTLGAFLLSLFFARLEWTNPEITEVIQTRYLLDLTWGALLFYLLVNGFLNIDVLLLRGQGLSEATVGYYKASASIGQILYFLFISISQVSYPLIAKLFAQNLNEELSKVVNKLFLAIFYATALAFVFTILFSDIIIQVFFGKAYLPAAGVTPWYTLSIGLLSIIIMLGNMMIVFEHKKNYLLYLLGSLVLYVVIVLFSTSWLEIYAPPMALIIVATLSSLLFMAILNHEYKRLFDLRGLGLTVGWLILMAVASVFVNRYLVTIMNPLIAGVLVFAVFGLVSYFTIRQVREAVKNSVIILLGKKRMEPGKGVIRDENDHPDSSL
jgi:O-antigen/teichoic acid export membrane protein